MKNTYLNELDRRVFIDIVPQSIQRDGQRVLDAMSKGDAETIRAIRLKYVRDAGLSQGGGGAGPGRMKRPRRGAVTVHNVCEAWMNCHRARQSGGDRQADDLVSGTKGG